MKLISNTEILGFCRPGDMVEDVTTAVAFDHGDDIVLENKYGKQILVNPKRVESWGRDTAIEENQDGSAEDDSK